MAPLPAPAEKPSQRVSDSQSHAKLSPPAQVAVFCAALRLNLQAALTNVREWVEDCWHEDYTGAPTDGSAWISGGDCNLRVLRGGSWLGALWLLRSAIRNRDTAGIRNNYIGFRVSRTLTP